MDLRKVVFVGGNPRTHPSVQIRCVDVAGRLGCDLSLCAKFASHIPDRYAVFVCVKPQLEPGQLSQLACRGVVLWDIVDVLPPRKNISVYLASTELAGHLFEDYGPVEVIPHHHCNFSGEPNPKELRKPIWLGSRPWLPRIRGFDFEAHFVERMTQEDVIGVFRQTGIGLNLRARRKIIPTKEFSGKALSEQRLRRWEDDLFDFHLALNSGIKLINCLGFGIPSISTDEPAYREIGEECTLFSSVRSCGKWIRKLQSEKDFYLEMRRRCLERARIFHIDNIVEKYKMLLKSL